MRILAYEHITGGGMLGDERMAALAPEGDAMLRALVDDLTAIPGVEVAALRDARLGGALAASVYRVTSAETFWPIFKRALHAVDAVWPIAPEQDGVLAQITHEILQAQRLLLGCRPEAVRITASKRATADVLAGAGVAAVPVYAQLDDLPRDAGRIVVKPDDGAGCQDTRLFPDRAGLQAWLRTHERAGQVFQPYIEGDVRSLSLLCCEGRARLLACNRQNIRVIGDAFEFRGVSVGAVVDADQRYEVLANAVARALPGLWGYCGVDFIESHSGPVVLEVNPRLTTAYAGLRRATGLNVAQLVLHLPASLTAERQGSHPARAVEVEIAHAF